MTEEVRFTLRIPKDLHDRAAGLASGSFMSLNGYVLLALKQVVEEEEYVPNPEDFERIKKAVEAAAGSKEVADRVLEGNSLIQLLHSQAQLNTTRD